MKKLLFILLPIALFSQTQNYPGVCIQCTDPTEKMDVNGKIKSRDIPLVSTAEYVLVTNADGVHRKVLLSSLVGNQFTCPTYIKNSSNPFYVLFTSASSVPNPNSSITVNGISFTQSGSWINNNTYFYSWTNFTGQPVTGNSIVVNFSGGTCTYAN